jgi:hypothetical protein
MHLSPAELDAYTRKVLDVCVDVTLAPSSNISSAFRTLNAVTNAFPQRAAGCHNVTPHDLCALCSGTDVHVLTEVREVRRPWLGGYGGGPPTARDVLKRHEFWRNRVF